MVRRGASALRRDAACAAAVRGAQLYGVMRQRKRLSHLRHRQAGERTREAQENARTGSKSAYVQIYAPPRRDARMPRAMRAARKTRQTTPRSHDATRGARAGA